jgi:hypothetical protein
MFKNAALLVGGIMVVGSAYVPEADARGRHRRRNRSKTLSQSDKLFIEAAKALYGEGLKIKRSKRHTTISPKPGGITQAKYNRYVKIYLGILRSYLTKLHGGHWRWMKKGYMDATGSSSRSRRRSTDPGKWDPRGKIKLAHLLLEPYIKYKICYNILARTGNRPNIVAAYQRLSWCALQAMQEAIAPIYEYRGSKVTWKAPADRGTLKLEDVIWKRDASGNYPMIITVRGGSKIYTLASTNILFALSVGVDANFAKKMRTKAKKLYKKTLKIYPRLVKKIARKQRKWAKRKKVIFGKNRFYATIAQKPAQGPLSCDGVYYMAWAPRRERKQGYQLGVEVNGVECSSSYTDAKGIFRSDVGGLSCTRYLKVGQNKIHVGLYLSHNSFNYKRTEWRNHRLKSVKYTKTRRGKKLYGNRIICTK